MNANTLELQYMEHLLGKLYCRLSGWKQPEIVQIVGWTKTAVKEGSKVKYAYVKYLHFNVNERSMYGGDGFLDKDSIQTDITKPVLRSAPGLSLLKINKDKEKEGFYLSKGSPSSSIYEYYSEMNMEDLNRKYRWSSPL